MSIRKYIDIVCEAEITQCFAEIRYNLREGEMIPLPDRILRVAASPHDLYQILKMNCNPNLAHKVNFTFSGNGTAQPGANLSDMFMIFFDDISMTETKNLLDHFKIDYLDGPELGSEMGRQVKSSFKSKLNPPTDADELFGQYFKKDKNPLKR
jgi:hypothetical protein